MERIHFASAALQLWAFVKLAPRSSKTSDAGTATQILIATTYIRECRGEPMSYMTRICSADVDDMEADHLDLDARDLDDSDYL